MKISNKISLVVALNSEYVIGTENKLPWHIPEDLAYFKQVTLGKPIIMGRKTFESIGRVLPGRKNIVISRSNFNHPGVTTYPSLTAAIAANQDVAELCIIGGGEIFKQAIEFANILHLTWVDVAVANPCAWFPKFDFSEWNLVTEHELLSQTGVKCLIQNYVR